MTTQTLKPKQVTKRLLSVLPERAQDVLERRYGLASASHETLESIGQDYGITRERVRQIENYALKQVVESKIYEEEKEAFDVLEEKMRVMGSVVAEDEFLAEMSDDPIVRNHVHFLLVLGEAFEKHKESEDFVHRWHIDQEVAEKVHNALKNVYKNLSDEDIVPESQIMSSFLEHLQDVSEEYKDEEILRRWLKLSKKIDRNPLGEWGASHSPNINLKGVRDFAYLVLREHGSPLHFTEVAKRIKEIFDKKAHTATTHNELIKDDRFVLVGRGLYALKEWGYMTGVVKDVIAEVLKRHGPMTKGEVVDKVMKERYVKENTIVVNLQNSDVFEKDKEGKYYFAS
jgi:DNA-directed RNA polymerase delta subunit